MTTAAPCPKSMVFGPCGGVHGVDSCEVDGIACPFVRSGTPGGAPVVERSAVPGPLLDGPIVMVDVRAPARWQGDARALWRDTAAVLDGAVALLGEHVDNPRREDDAGSIDETEAIAILRTAGVPTVATVTGRDRDLTEARRRIAALSIAGAVAVHCVTGDHPAALAIDRPVRFGAEGTTLAAEAARDGVAVSVAESPSSPGERIARVLAKERAGATLCVLNHGGDVGDLVAFVDACRAHGSGLRFVAPVPMVGDRMSALALARFPGLRLPRGLLERINSADDPLAEGLTTATSLTRELMGSGRFVGIDLSGSASSGGPAERLDATALFVAAALRGIARA